MNAEKLHPELDDLGEATEFLSRKWQPLIVFVLSERDQMGFNELKDSLDSVSGKVLSENLTELEEQDFVEKNVLSESPKRVDYSLTDRGRGLRPILDEMIAWANSDDVKILVVEDEKSLADLYVDWLSSKYNVVKALSGSEALDKMDGCVDLVFLDRELPDSSGEEISNKFSDVYDCSIVFTTAHDPEVDIVDMPVDEYLTKPVSKEEMLDVVSNILGREDLTEFESKLLSLESKKNVLEEEKDVSWLESKKEYQDLIDRIDELRNKT